MEELGLRLRELSERMCARVPVCVCVTIYSTTGCTRQHRCLSLTLDVQKEGKSQRVTTIGGWGWWAFLESLQNIYSCQSVWIWPVWSGSCDEGMTESRVVWWWCWTIKCCDSIKIRWMHVRMPRIQRFDRWKIYISQRAGWCSQYWSTTECARGWQKNNSF